MEKFYRAPNKRLIARGAGGRFRRSTLGDVGLSCCEKCGKVFTPDFSALKDDPFPDPRRIRDIRSTCPECAEK